MNSIIIGNSKLTSVQVDRVLSGEKVNKVMTIWDKIKDFFHISDKKQVMTLLYDVYYNPEVSFLDKLDKFKEIRELSLDEFKDTFNIKINCNIFYFEIGHKQDDAHISQSYNEIDYSEEQKENIFNNQSIESIFNELQKDDIYNLKLMITGYVNSINEMKNKSTEDKLHLIKSSLSLLLNDDDYRNKEIDSFKKETSLLNEITSKKVCSGMTKKEAMDKTWKIIKENCNEEHDDYHMPLLISHIFSNAEDYIDHKKIGSFLTLQNIINKDRKILDIESTPEKVTFFLLDENNHRIISNEYSNIAQKFNLDFAAFEYMINNKNLYSNVASKEDKEKLNEFLYTFNILSEKLNKKDKNLLFINMLNLKKESFPLMEKLKLIELISNQFNDSNIDKKMDIKINKEKQIEFKIKTSEKGKDDALELNSFFTIPYDDNNLSLLNIDKFNYKNLSIRDKINILSKLDEYNKKLSVLKSHYYHNLANDSELKKELKKEDLSMLISEKNLDLFNLSESEKGILENLPKSITFYSAKEIYKIFKYYKEILSIKNNNSNDENIKILTIDNLISNGNKRQEAISTEFFTELNETIKDNVNEKLKKLEIEFKNKKINILSSNKVNAENNKSEKYLDIIFSGKFNEIIEKNYKDGKFKNKTNLLEFKVDKESKKNEDIIKIRISEEYPQDYLINIIQEYVSSPVDFLKNKLINSREKEKLILNSEFLAKDLLTKIDKEISVLMKNVKEISDINHLNNLLLIYQNARKTIINNLNINKFAKKEKENNGSIINDTALDLALLNNIDMLDTLLSNKHIKLDNRDQLITEKKANERLLPKTPILYDGMEMTIKINKKIKNEPVIEMSGNYNQIRM